MYLSIDRGFVSQIHAYHVTTVSNRGKYFVIRGPVLVYGKTMVIAVILGNYTRAPFLQPRNPDAFRQRGNDP